MLYSVYNYNTKRYDYFEHGGASISSVAHFRHPQGNAIDGTFLPEALTLTVPSGAKFTGSGDVARGVVARKGAGIAAWFPAETRPTLAWGLLFLGLGFGTGWWFYRRRR
jgi:hypothetical protein